MRNGAKEIRMFDHRAIRWWSMGINRPRCDPPIADANKTD